MAGARPSVPCVLVPVLARPRPPRTAAAPVASRRPAASPSAPRTPPLASLSVPDKPRFLAPLPSCPERVLSVLRVAVTPGRDMSGPETCHHRPRRPPAGRGSSSRPPLRVAAVGSGLCLAHTGATALSLEHKPRGPSRRPERLGMRGDGRVSAACVPRLLQRGCPVGGSVFRVSSVVRQPGCPHGLHTSSRGVRRPLRSVLAATRCAASVSVPWPRPLPQRPAGSLCAGPFGSPVRGAS